MTKKVITPFVKLNKYIDNSWENLKLSAVIKRAVVDPNKRYYMVELKANVKNDDKIYIGRLIWDTVDQTFYNYNVNDEGCGKFFTTDLGTIYYLDIINGFMPESLVKFANEHNESIGKEIERIIVDDMI